MTPNTTETPHKSPHTPHRAFGGPRLTALALLVAIAGCGGGSSPAEPASCTNVAGSYRASGSNSCGGTVTNQPVVVAQSVCSFTAALPGATVTGTISGNTAALALVFVAPCAGTASGTAMLTSSAIVGTYSGTATASGAGCCPLGADVHPKKVLQNEEKGEEDSRRGESVAEAMHGIRLIRALTPGLFETGLPTIADEEMRFNRAASLAWRRSLRKRDREMGFDRRRADRAYTRLFLRMHDRLLESASERKMREMRNLSAP